MEVQITLTPDQEAFVREGVASGRFESAQAAMTVAVQQWEEYERRRMELLFEIRLGSEQIERGECTHIDSPEELDAFFEKIKREGRARLAAKTKVPA